MAAVKEPESELYEIAAQEKSKRGQGLGLTERRRADCRMCPSHLSILYVTKSRASLFYRMMPLYNRLTIKSAYTTRILEA